VLQQPFGPFLLGSIALGLARYGLFCFARAATSTTEQGGLTLINLAS